MSYKYALGQYIRENNSKFKHQILYEDKDFVLIKDQFPKSIIHWLLLPRDPLITFRNPLTDAFKDDKLREKVEDLIPMIKRMIMIEIERLGYQVTEKYNDDFISIGVHAVPSMANLHIHFITKDLSTERMKRRHHYNSFTTRFFVNFNELPLSQDDERINSKEMEQHCNRDDLVCHVCGENFANQFAQLKRHLQRKFPKILIKKRDALKVSEVIEID